jgi:endoplasmic reticulum-Golgi intermediate compartment protein 3
MGFKDRLKTLDSHSTVSSEFRVYSLQGAVLSVVTLLAICYLMVAESTFHLSTDIKDRVHVNATSPVGLNVEFDISLPQVPCSSLNIDANDPTGQAQSLHLDRQHHVWKHRIKFEESTGKVMYIGDRKKLELGSTFLKEEHWMEDIQSKLANNINLTEQGTEDARKLEIEEAEEEEEACGSCYGAGEEGECCNTCDDVKRAYNRKGWHLADPRSITQCSNEQAQGETETEGEGCNVHGIVALSTGGGSFHLAPGRSLESIKKETSGSDPLGIMDLLTKAFEQWNVSHTVHKIRFGDEFPGHVHQLDGAERTITDGYGMYQYYLQVS